MTKLPARVQWLLFWLTVYLAHQLCGRYTFPVNTNVIFWHPCSRDVFTVHKTGREHGPWTRVVCLSFTELHRYTVLHSTYTVSGKRCRCSLPDLTDFQNSFSSSNQISTTLQTRRYTTLWNVCAQKACVLTPNHWLHQSASRKWLTLHQSDWYLSIAKSRLMRSINPINRNQARFYAGGQTDFSPLHKASKPPTVFWDFEGAKGKFHRSICNQSVQLCVVSVPTAFSILYSSAVAV